jgi:hypothetical protein
MKLAERSGFGGNRLKFLAMGQGQEKVGLSNSTFVPVCTAIFFYDFWGDFLLLIDVNEWINNVVLSARFLTCTFVAGSLVHMHQKEKSKRAFIVQIPSP